MKVKDYYYSGEVFELVTDGRGILKTQPIPDDIGRYYDTENYISHANSKKSIIEKIYAKVQAWNFRYKKKILSKYSVDGKVLDYGCGNGAFLNYLENNSKYTLFGYEPISEVQETKSTIYRKLENIQEEFDIIMLWHVFEHIENREEVLQNLRNKLTPNGIILIAIPNFASLDAQYYKEEWAAWDVPRHFYHYSREGAIQYFTQVNHFYLNRIYPLPFDSFYISLISAQYKNSILQKMLAPFVGTLSNLSALFTRESSSLIYVLKNTNEA